MRSGSSIPGASRIVRDGVLPSYSCLAFLLVGKCARRTGRTAHGRSRVASRLQDWRASVLTEACLLLPEQFDGIELAQVASRDENRQAHAAEDQSRQYSELANGDSE